MTSRLYPPAPCKCLSPKCRAVRRRETARVYFVSAVILFCIFACAGILIMIGPTP